MEGLDPTVLINELNIDPRLIAALVAIVSIIKRTIWWLHDRSAEITAFVVAQMLAWGNWFADMFPIISTVGMNVLTGVALWVTGKAGYKAFQKVINDKGYSSSDDEKHVDDTEKENNNDPPRSTTRSTDGSTRNGTETTNGGDPARAESLSFVRADDVSDQGTATNRQTYPRRSTDVRSHSGSGTRV